MPGSFTASPSSLRLRPGTGDDADFLFGLYATSRAEELDRTGWDAATRTAFLRMQLTAQQTHYTACYPDAQFNIVEQDGCPVGRLYVDRSEQMIRVIDIALLPAFRGRGIGTTLLRNVLAEASTLGRVVTLHVECFNPARRWYEWLGFTEVASDGVYVLMRHEAPVTKRSPDT